MTTDTLPQVGTELPPSAPRRRRWVAVVVALALVVAGTLAWRAWSDHRADIRSGTTLVSTEELAAQYGIDVNLIAVTAAGGLIEFRYQVVDPDKAARLLHDAKLAPAFVVEKTGETLVMSSPPHSHGAELRLGGTYYFLMANARNAVHRGTSLTLVIGDLRVEHLAVEG
jgi:hypothetical protein